MKQNQNNCVYIKEPMGRRVHRLVFRWLRRGILLAAVAGGLYALSAYEYVGTILTGPSPTARDQLAMTLFDDKKTSWLPGRFMESKDIAALSSVSGTPETEREPAEKHLSVDMDLPVLTENPEWNGCQDGIRIKKIPGETFQAYGMLIRDPSRVYLGLSNQELARNIPGKRINEAMESEGAVAAINSGAFYDNGTSQPAVGATPEGLVISRGSCAWEKGTPPSKGFAGFTEDDRLYVSTSNITKAQAEELGIRDGCCFGPALIIDGKPNPAAYKMLPGRQPRTAIGQREDGTVIFLCIDGRQASSVGGEIGDMIQLMTELGAVNACNMDGGSSTVMMYRDSLGRYGDAGEMYMVNSYSQLQPEPRRMPDYWMVRPGKEG